MHWLRKLEIGLPAAASLGGAAARRYPEGVRWRFRSNRDFPCGHQCDRRGRQAVDVNRSGARLSEI